MTIRNDKWLVEINHTFQFHFSDEGIVLQVMALSMKDLKELGEVVYMYLLATVD
jgi:hypothetical protein